MSKLYLKPNPTLQDVQQYVKEMEKERGFDDNTVAQKCLLLAEEIGELLKSVRKTHNGMGRDVSDERDQDSAGEIADIIIVLNAIANRLNIDIEKALRDKEEINKKRVWQRQKKTT